MRKLSHVISAVSGTAPFMAPDRGGKVQRGEATSPRSQSLNLAPDQAPSYKERKVTSAWTDAGVCDAEHGGRQGTFLSDSAV